MPASPLEGPDGSREIGLARRGHHLARDQGAAFDTAKLGLKRWDNSIKGPIAGFMGFLPDDHEAWMAGSAWTPKSGPASSAACW